MRRPDMGTWGRTASVVRMWRKQKGICYLCGKSMCLRYGKPNSATIEHITPKSVLHGEQAERNHKAACYSCNQAKGGMTASEYLKVAVSTPRACP